MTDKEKLDKLVAEIERLIGDYNIKIEKYRGVNEQAHQYYGGRRDALSEILKSIDSMQEEPVSENYGNALNSVAITFLQEQQIVPNFYADIIMKAVKRGANWQKEQLMAKAIDAKIAMPYPSIDGFFTQLVDTKEVLPFGDDKVKVIVIKEE